MRLRNTVAPNLPLATKNYESLYQEQFNNVLRLYFNQLDNFTGAVSNTGGGSNLQFPNGAWHQDGVTTLTTGITNVSTTPIVVDSTSDFSDSGAILIENELIAYTGKTSTTFTGITRGAYGSTKAAHIAGVYVSEGQPVPSATTALAIAMRNTDISNQISADTVDPSKIVFQVPGYYNIQFSIQLSTYDSTIDNVTLWFRQNGTDIANTAGVITVPAIHAGLPGAVIASWNLVLPVAANDYVQLMMSSISGNTVALTYPPGTAPVRPSSPSVIMTATFVSALYT